MKHKHLLLSLASISLVALLSLGTLGFVKAQQNGAPKSMSSLPRLYLSNIKLNETSYKVGDTVKGTFDIQNGDVDATPDIKYLVSLVGLSPDGHVARVEYDTKEEGPVSIEGKTTKTISFSYDIKTAPSNDNLAIHIRAILKDGNSLAWYLTPIKISGGLSMMNVVDGFVTLNGNKYGLQEGPTVKASERIAFTGAYFNKSSANVSLTPTTVMLDKSNQPITNIVPITGQSVEFLRNATSTVTFDLPVTSLKQGVYLAKTSLLDAKGNKRVPDLFARYIVAGDIVNVRSVYSDANFPLKKDQKLTLAVGYTGNPVDITKITSASSTPTSTPVIANIEVILKNQDNETVTDTTLKDQSFSIVGFSQVPVTLSNNASSLTAEVVVSQNENVLARYTGNVVYDASRKFLNPGESKNPYLLYYYIAAVLLAIILLVIVFFWRRKYLMAVVVLVVAVGGGVVRGFNITEYSGGSVWSSISVGGGPPSDVVPGQVFGVPVTVAEESCSNASAVGTVVSTNYLDQTNNTGIQYAGAYAGYVGLDPSNHAHYIYWTKYVDYYIGTYTAPSYGGYTNFYASVYNYSYNNGWINRGHVSGYWPVLVDTCSNGATNYPSCNVCPAGQYQKLWGGNCSPDPIGALDVASCSSFAGWVCDPSDYSQPITVNIFKDGPAGAGGTFSTQVANFTLYRPDISAAGLCGGNSYAGFEIPIPVSLKDGLSHSIYAYGINIGAGNNSLLLNTPKTITCAAQINASCSPSPTSTTTGSNINWISTVTGGTPPYTYYWNDGTTDTNHLSSTIRNYNTDGSKSMSLQVVDSLLHVSPLIQCSPNSTISTPTITSISCRPLQTQVTIGNNVKWISTVSGGTPPYTYNWWDKSSNAPPLCITI